MKHEQKYCPRCGTPFECRVGSITLCQCSTVELSEAELAYIESLYDDCLCANCMKELKAAYHKQEYQNQLKRILGIFYKPYKK